MSLRTKIAIGVLAATAVLAVALAYLGFEAKRELDRAAENQRARTQQQFEELRVQYHQAAVRAIEDHVLAWVRGIAGTPVSELGFVLGSDDNAVREAAIVTRRPNGMYEVQVQKPRGSRISLGEDELREIRQVFEGGKHRFSGDVLYHPYFLGDEAQPVHVLRLQLNMPRLTLPELTPPETPDLSALWVAAFTTLALAMLAVFVLLMFALRRFVLAPLGNVLRDSELIVKGDTGLEVRGLKGGRDDIATMVAAFNAMFTELKDYQADLEGKVREATQTIKQQQQSLVIAQRLAATGTLAAGLAHEVNNPLSGMLNAARRLRMREGLDERARDYVTLIEEGLARIENLMKQILDFSRRRDMKPERFSAENALRRSVPLVRHRLEKRRLRLDEDIQQDVPPVFGNEEEIAQVLMNLLINAMDAAREGGTVRVGISRDADEGVLYTVEDDGDGVPEEIRGRIFDPFFTTKEPGKGTGLGLSIVHTIIDNHGGRLEVDRSPRLGGARFAVHLPQAARRESTRRLAAAAE